MSADITTALSANPIKNGTAITTTSVTGFYQQLNTYVKNTPVLADIENKYDNRFDDPRYYYSSTT